MTENLINEEEARDICDKRTKRGKERREYKRQEEG